MPTKPTGHNLEQLTQALLDAFTYDELTIFTRHKLDQSLEQVTPVHGTHEKITAELVYRFARQENGRIMLQLYQNQNKCSIVFQSK